MKNFSGVRVMKYKGIYFSLFSLFLKKPMVKKFGKDKTKESLQKGRILYREMLESTKDVGEKNPMAHNIYSAYVFLAVCRAGNFSVEDFREIIAAFMDNRIIRKAMSSIDFNKETDMKKFAERMHKAEEWAEAHPEYQDKTWDFHFDEKRHKDGFYYHFTRCPLEKFAREHGYLDLLPLCCDIDHIAVERNKGVLHREHTLATGGTICDYWFVGNQMKNPR